MPEEDIYEKLKKKYGIASSTTDTSGDIYADLKRKYGTVNEPAPRSTGTSINKSYVAPPEESDSLLSQFGKSIAQATLSAPASIVSGLGNLTGSETIQNAGGKLDRFVASLEPKVYAAKNETDANLQALVQTAGEVLGTVGIQSGIYSGAKAALTGAAKVAPASIAGRATQRILGWADQGRKATLALGAGEQTASQVANVITSAPLNVGSSLLANTITNPASLSNPQELALNTGLAFFDSLLGSKKSALNKIDDNLPDYSKRIDARISREDKAALKNIKEFGRDLYQGVVDSNAPIKSIDAKAGKAAQLAAGAAGKAEQYLENKPFLDGPDGNPVWRNDVKSFKQVLEEAGNIPAYERAALAAHVVELNNKGIRVKTGIDLPDAIREVENAPANIKQAIADGTAYNNSLLDYAGDLLSPEAKDTFKRLHTNYVSLERVFDKVSESISTRNKIGTASPFHKLDKGGDYLIKSPVLSTIERTELIMKSKARNDIGKELLNYMESNPKNGWVEKVPLEEFRTPWLNQAADLLADVAAKQGIPILRKDAVELTHALYGPLKVQDNVISVWSKGQLQQLKVDPVIAKAYDAMSPRDFNFLVKIVGLPAQTLRAGITLNPVFGFFNAVRDTFNATLQSQYGFRPGVDSWRGFMESIGKGKYKGQMRQELLAAGGGLSGITSVDTSNLASAVRHLTPSKGALDKVVTKIAHPIDALRQLARPFEEAARLGEFIKGKEQGATAIEAALAARNVTTDFAQMGTSMQALNYMTAFLNPAIQSLNTIKNVAKSQPGSLALKGAAAVSLPSILLWAANKDDQEIEDLRKTEGGLANWFIRLPNGTIGKIPKPFLYGQAFGTSMESALDAAFDKDPAAGKRFVQGIRNQTLFNVLPTALSTYVSYKANSDQFTGMPIVPRGQEDIDPTLQSTAGTTGIAKKISAIASGVGVEVSPINIDYGIKQTFGTLGNEGIKTADKLLGLNKGKPSESLASTPFIGRFFARYPSQSTEPIRTFYDKLDESNEVMRTIARLESTNNLAGLEKYIDKKRDILPYAPIYMKTFDEIKKIQETIRQINDAEGMTGDDKRDTIDELTKSMVEIARNVNEAVYESQK